MTTTLRAADGRVEIATNSTERTAAGTAIAEILGQKKAAPDATQVRITIPAELEALVMAVLESVAKGERISVGSLPETLTTSVAADQLGISRPTLMKLIASGELPSQKVGTHTRIRTDDVIAFRRARLERQARALDELRQLDDQWGL